MSIIPSVWRPSNGNGEATSFDPNYIVDTVDNNLVDTSGNFIVDTGSNIVSIPATEWEHDEGE